VVTPVSETAATAGSPASAPAPANVAGPDERGRAETKAGIGWWLQLGAFKQREGALDFQRKLIDEQPWLAPLLAVFTDHGLNRLQAGPYTSRDEARSAAEHVRSALRLVPTIVEKR
jgi:rare lipoprotein A